MGASRLVRVTNRYQRPKQAIGHSVVLLAVSILAVLAFFLGSGVIEPDAEDAGGLAPVWEEDEG